MRGIVIPEFIEKQWCFAMVSLARIFFLRTSASKDFPLAHFVVATFSLSLPVAFCVEDLRESSSLGCFLCDQRDTVRDRVPTV